jgi:hypothetical protein
MVLYTRALFEWHGNQNLLRQTNGKWTDTQAVRYSEVLKDVSRVEKRVHVCDAVNTIP